MSSEDECTCNDADLMHGETDNCVASLYANEDVISDCDLLIPLWLDDKEVLAIRDSGNMGPVLVSEDLVPPEKWIPGKFSFLQGVFDARTGENKIHKLPMARVKIRSPWFEYDQNVTIEAAVCKLPNKISCVIGQSLFKEKRMLRDVITVRRKTGPQWKPRTQKPPNPDRAVNTDIQHNSCNNELSDLQSKHTCSVNGNVAGPTHTAEADRSHRSQNDTQDDGRSRRTTDMAQGPTDMRATLENRSNEKHDEIDKTGQTEGRGDVTSNNMSNSPDTETATPPTVIDTVNAVTTRASAARNTGKQGSRQSADRRNTDRPRVNNDLNEARLDEQPDPFAQAVQELGNIDINPVTANSDVDSQNASEFAREQKNDLTLQHLWIKAERGSSELNVIHGLLYRNVPINISSMHDQALVIPTKFQPNLIHIAHSSPLSGHLGIQKTYQRLAALFYFPQMRKKVKNYIRCCKSCQMTAPKRKQERQPLRELDVMATHAFDDVSLDIIGGDLPKTPRNNRWMMVMIDNLSRWIHCTPLRSLKAAAIAEALIEIWSYTGIPRVLRTDCMPSFRSELMAAVRQKLGVEAKFSAPMHYESHGRIERVQATIENIIKRCARDHPKMWDKLIPYIHFALRSVPHSSTGVSPAELVWGRKMRGILEVIRETWTQQDPMQGYCKMSTCDYMKELNDRIDETLKIASQNSSKAQARMKEHYDKSSSVRELRPGDSVLVLMPTSNNKLFATWKGPFEVLRRFENDNYEIQMDGRKAKWHVNALRKYSFPENDGERVNMMVVSLSLIHI